jgi:hypothetical protein
VTIRRFVAALIATVSFSGVPVAADCPILPLENLFAQSSAVFVGRAVSQRVVADDSGHAHNGLISETTLEVEEIWKGQAGQSGTLPVRVCGYYDPATGNTVTCGTGNRFVVGSRYVVFAYGDPLRASPECDQHFGTVENMKDILQWLADKPSTRLAIWR